MNRILRFNHINLKALIKRKASTNGENSVTVDFSNGIKTITMCDTRTRNALSLSMMENLINNIQHDSNNPNLRVIVIGAVGNVFSTGHNLKELSSSNSESQHQRVFDMGSELMNAIIDSPVPIIAKVNGVAAAAGCQLVAQCDLTISSMKSTFSTPGINIGLFCSTPAVALSRSVPKSTSMKMLLTGKPISAQEAKYCGLVAEICEEGELDALVHSYCEELKAKSREVITLGKAFYYHQMNLNSKLGYNEGGIVMVKNLQLEDGKEGINSFIEKRTPNWTHGIRSS